jgi:hypothetical protein
MNAPTFRDAVRLSSYLDDRLSRADKRHLEIRLQSEPGLDLLFADLRSARAALRRTPRRRIPRSFILKAGMVGLRPPVPRLVPAFSWASAAAALMFIITLGSNLVGRLSFGAAAPAPAAMPLTSEAFGYGGGPPASEAPAKSAELSTPTPEVNALMAPSAADTGQTGSSQPVEAPAAKAASQPVTPWVYLWVLLAIVLILAALVIRAGNLRAFRRRLRGK